MLICTHTRTSALGCVSVCVCLGIISFGLGQRHNLISIRRLSLPLSLTHFNFSVIPIIRIILMPRSGFFSTSNNNNNSIDNLSTTTTETAHLTAIRLFLLISALPSLLLRWHPLHRCRLVSLSLSLSSLRALIVYTLHKIGS